jgi:hypothetical protein
VEVSTGLRLFLIAFLNVDNIELPTKVQLLYGPQKCQLADFFGLFLLILPYKKRKKSAAACCCFKVYSPYSNINNGRSMDNFRRGLHSFFVTSPKMFQL